MIYNYLAYNRSKLVWGKDADKFKPERWLSPGTLPTHLGWSGQFTFAYGARMCIGMRLGESAPRHIAHYVSTDEPRWDSVV